MMRSSVAILALVGAAVAASNPLIPSGISSGCSTFLSQLDSDSTLQSCTSPLISASSPFSPLSSGSSKTSIDSALNTLCASENACDAAYVRTQLTSFYGACSADMSNSADVQRAYDTLYALAPFVQAVCQKDDASNAYCVSSLASSTGAGKADFAVKKTPVSLKDLYTTIKTTLRRRATTGSAAAKQTPLLVPNTTTFAAQNILFLALTPSSPSAQLCSACSKSILTTYATFEQSIPYASSYSSSVLFAGQADLFSAASKTCGADFVGNAGAQAAGGLKGSSMSTGGASGRVAKAGMGVTALVAVIAGAMFA